jgi:hypothetical protein
VERVSSDGLVPSSYLINACVLLYTPLPRVPCLSTNGVHESLQRCRHHVGVMPSPRADAARQSCDDKLVEV